MFHGKQYNQTHHSVAVSIIQAHLKFIVQIG